METVKRIELHATIALAIIRIILSLYQAKILLILWFKSTVDLVVHWILLLSFIYTRATLGIVAMYLEFLDSSVVEEYR